MTRFTTASVHAALRAQGAASVALHNGKGYWYFVHNDGKWYDTHSVYVYRLNSLPLERWVEEGMEFYRRSTAQMERAQATQRTGPIRVGIWKR